METSDDPTGGLITAKLIAPIIIGAAVSEGVKSASGQPSIFGKGHHADDARSAGIASALSPSQEKRTATAAPGSSLSEQAKKNRRLQASSLTRDFAPPTLGVPGLTGV